MHLVTLLALLFLMSGCATTPKREHQITMADTAWIQKGSTTRSEVETRFGSPNFEVPEYRGLTRETTSTTTPRNDQDAPTTETTVNVQSPNETKATYLHPKSSSNMQTKEDRFWLTYGPNNVVKDFGFADPPTPAPTNAQR